MRQIKTAAALTGLLILAGILTACSPGGKTDETGTSRNTASPQKITAEEARERMDSGDDIVILDVRTKEEYEEKHIPGAILIPNEEIGEEPLADLPSLDQEILIYCRSGNRSAQAANKMTAAGYTRIYDFGGIIDWPYDTESGTADEQRKEAAEPQKTDAHADGPFGSFETMTLEGDPVTQNIFGDASLTMVNFWATYCGACIQHMPYLTELDGEYRDRGLQILGVITDVDEPENDAALTIAKSAGTDYTQIIASDDLRLGVLSEIQYIPTTIFLDQNGTQLGETYVGGKTKDEWAKIVEELLEQVNE
ncbi:redoxin family protein [Ruminococcus sp. OA3]|uniref:rhodanese-like domain-containing protein n=1 Tax=Ruminococcus sp. OA3 TaxID=2914164 RepID=UPI001F05A40E|nr:rhodanese-like domain-containing protein [Ruminococcus sp. OA3]MCH1982327.1 redoxin family protein [Ruminococcus sp. OA3]